MPIMWSILLHSSEFALQKMRRLSYVKKDVVDSHRTSLIGTLVMLPFASALVKREVSASAHIINRYGDMRSPCRRPLEGLKHYWGSPLTRIGNETMFTDATIMETHLGSKHILLIIASKNDHSTVLYILLISSLRCTASGKSCWNLKSGYGTKKDYLSLILDPCLTLLPPGLGVMYREMPTRQVIFLLKML